jgi:hypothetical protein
MNEQKRSGEQLKDSVVNNLPPVATPPAITNNLVKEKPSMGKTKKYLLFLSLLVIIIALAVIAINVIKKQTAVKNGTSEVVYPTEGSADGTLAPSAVDTSGQEEVLAPPALPAE